MPRKIADALIDHAVKLIFTDGMMLKDVAVQVGVSKDALSKHIRRRGLDIPKTGRQPPNYRHDLSNDLLISLYESGISEFELSKRFNISRGAIRNRLLNGGVHIRGQSEANIVSMRKMTSEQRKQRAKAANIALRGRKQNVDGRRKRANGILFQPYENMTGIGEKEFKDLLEQSGVDFVWQKPFDVYNIDFAIGNVAVELKCGSATNATSDKKRGRIKQLRESGIISLYIVFKTIEDLTANFDYIISNVNILNSNPSPIGKYWVIRSRFDNFTRLRNEFGQFAAIKSTPKLFHSIKMLDY